MSHWMVTGAGDVVTTGELVVTLGVAVHPPTTHKVVDVLKHAFGGHE